MAGWVCGLLTLMIMMLAWICGWDLWPGPVARPVSYNTHDNDVDEIDADMMHIQLMTSSTSTSNIHHHTMDMVVAEDGPDLGSIRAISPACRASAKRGFSHDARLFSAGRWASLLLLGAVSQCRS